MATTPLLLPPPPPCSGRGGIALEGEGVELVDLILGNVSTRRCVNRVLLTRGMGDLVQRNIIWVTTIAK